jgi:3-hydroxybutyryl-CoA dehydrogenase
MGSGIAEMAARSGFDVVVQEVDEARADAGRRKIDGSLARGLRAGKLTDDEIAAAQARLRFVTDLGELADREVVVEAIIEDEEAKKQVFTALDKVVEDPSAILASNTSSIPIMKLGMATGRPEQVIGIHFFNPVPCSSWSSWSARCSPPSGPPSGRPASRRPWAST